MAYNAGAGGLRTYLKGGLSDSKRKEVAGYVPGFQNGSLEYLGNLL